MKYNFILTLKQIYWQGKISVAQCTQITKFTQKRFTLFVFSLYIPYFPYYSRTNVKACIWIDAALHWDVSIEPQTCGNDFLLGWWAHFIKRYIFYRVPSHLCPEWQHEQNYNGKRRPFRNLFWDPIFRLRKMTSHRNIRLNYLSFLRSDDARLYICNAQSYAKVCRRPGLDQECHVTRSCKHV